MSLTGPTGLAGGTGPTGPASGTGPTGPTGGGGGGGGPLTVTGEIVTPDLAGATFNDFNPAGFDGLASIIVVTNSDPNSVITGLKAQAVGRVVFLYAPQSNGAQFNVLDQGGGSLPANRFAMPGFEPWLVAPGSVLGVRYDGVLSRWAPFSFWSERMASLLLDGFAQFNAGITIVGNGINDSGTGAGLITTGAVDTVGIVNRGRLLEKSIITPVAITGAHNDYNPVDALDPTLDLSGARFLRQPLSGAASLTGLLAPNAFNDGQHVTIRNLDAVLTLTLNHENGGSLAANRFNLPGGVSLVITPFGSADLWHDPLSNRWVVI
jgi:hypothetical protein